MFWLVYFLHSLRVLVLILVLDNVGLSTKNTSAGLLETRVGDTIAPKYYIVRPGDSLYSIGFYYGISYQQLARWNDLVTPFTIKVGDKLKIYQPNQLVVGNAEIRNTDRVSLKKLIEVTKNLGNSISSIDFLKIYFNWPSEGRVIKAFSRDDNHGINIAGQFGSPIRAVASGTVVYSGDGITGYGNLLILKHDEQLMSAYANNQRLLVKEGDQVDQGQVIAEMGGVGETAQLHFEIRKNGVAIDPLDVLPAQ